MMGGIANDQSLSIGLSATVSAVPTMFYVTSAVAVSPAVSPSL